MTLCVTQNGSVIHVGEWDYQLQPIVQADEDRPIFEVIGGQKVLAGYHPKTVGQQAENPLPDGAEIVDEKLAWTADGRIVLASDKAAVRSFENA